MRMIFILLLSPIFMHAQNAELIDSAGNIYYSEIVQVDSATASDLYSRAKLMVAIIYNSGKDVTQLNDDQQKRVVTKGNAVINEPVFMQVAEMHINFQMILQCRDGRYRFDIATQGYSGHVSTTRYNEETLDKKPEAWPRKKWDEVLEKTHNKMQDVVLLIKKHMATKADENW